MFHENHLAECAPPQRHYELEVIRSDFPLANIHTLVFGVECNGERLLEVDDWLMFLCHCKVQRGLLFVVDTVLNLVVVQGKGFVAVKVAMKAS